MGVLLILVDAFSYDYLKPRYTPFLVEMAKDGVAKPLRPMFAYRGIEATIFSGEWPTTHNIWTEFRLRTKRATRLSGRLLSRGLGFLDNARRERVSKLARLSVTMMSNLCIARQIPNLIPGRFLLYFEPSMRKPIWHSKSVNVGTIFDWLRSRRGRFVCMERIPPLQDDAATARRFERVILREKPSFAWVKLNSLDTAGHTYGPNVSLLREDLAQIDMLVQELVGWGQKAGLHDVIVMSDHGMSFVKKWHNLRSLLDELQEDMLFFLDSTMARFWYRNKSQKDRVVDVLKSLPYGRILTSQDMVTLKVPTDTRYGETIFVLDTGHVLYPDFWTWQKAKGMHGYAYQNSIRAYPFLLANHEMTSCACSENKNFFEFTDIMTWVTRKLESDAA